VVDQQRGATSRKRSTRNHLVNRWLIKELHPLQIWLLLMKM
jgi:hypothetical protein